MPRLVLVCLLCVCLCGCLVTVNRPYNKQYGFAKDNPAPYQHDSARCEDEVLHRYPPRTFHIPPRFNPKDPAWRGMNPHQMDRMRYHMDREHDEARDAERAYREAQDLTRKECMGRHGWYDVPVEEELF